VAAAVVVTLPAVATTPASIPAAEAMAVLPAVVAAAPGLAEKAAARADRRVEALKQIHIIGLSDVAACPWSRHFFVVFPSIHRQIPVDEYLLQGLRGLSWGRYVGH